MKSGEFYKFHSALAVIKKEGGMQIVGTTYVFDSWELWEITGGPYTPLQASKVFYQYKRELLEKLAKVERGE